MAGFLLVLAAVAAVALLGEALVPRGLPGGPTWAIAAGVLGAALATAVVIPLTALMGRALLWRAPRTPQTYVAETIEVRIKRMD